MPISGGICLDSTLVTDVDHLHPTHSLPLRRFGVLIINFCNFTPERELWIP